MKLAAQDLRDLNLFKYYRLVRKWACKTYKLTDADLELLIQIAKVDLHVMNLQRAFIHIHGIKTDGKDYVKMVGQMYGVIETELQLNIVYTKPHLNLVNLYPVYTESYWVKRIFQLQKEIYFTKTNHIVIEFIINLLMI